MQHTQMSIFVAQIMAEPERHRAWCENVLLAPAESCVDTAQTALDNALDELVERLGRNMAQWQWGKLHHTQYEHNPFSQVPILRRLFHRSIPNGGTFHTVNLAGVHFSDRYDQYGLPSYRQIINLNDLPNSRYILELSPNNK
jgi:penicillin G amidase